MILGLIFILCQGAQAQTIPKPVGTPSAVAPRGKSCPEGISLGQCDSNILLGCGVVNGKLRLGCFAPKQVPAHYDVILDYNPSTTSVDVDKLCRTAKRIFEDPKARKAVLCPPRGTQPEGGTNQWLDENMTAACNTGSSSYGSYSKDLNCSRPTSSGHSNGGSR